MVSQSILYPHKDKRRSKCPHAHTWCPKFPVKNSSTNLSILILIQARKRFSFIFFYFSYPQSVCVVCACMSGCIRMSLCRSHWCRFSLTVMHLVHSHVLPWYCAQQTNFLQNSGKTFSLMIFTPSEDNKKKQQNKGKHILTEWETNGMKWMNSMQKHIEHALLLGESTCT